MRYLQSHHDLEGVIDSPLSTGKSTDHDDAKGKSSGEKAQHANLLNSLRRFNNNMKSANSPVVKKRIENLKDKLDRNMLTSPTVAPLALLRKETRLSAG